MGFLSKALGVWPRQSLGHLALHILSEPVPPWPSGLTEVPVSAWCLPTSRTLTSNLFYNPYFSSDLKMHVKVFLRLLRRGKIKEPAKVSKS